MRTVPRAFSLLRRAALPLLFACTAHAAPADHPAAMALAVDRWLASQKPSGLLVYGYDVLADAEVEPGAPSAQNLTRQAGAAAALADYRSLTKDARADPLLRGLLAALHERSRPIGKSALQAMVESLRLLSLPVGRYKLHAALRRFGLLYTTEGPGRVVMPGADYAQAHAGATALALLAEVRYAQATGDERFAEARRGWLEGLVALRIPGEGFRIVPTMIDTVPYYDGEAWLALAEYHRAHPHDARVATLLADVDADLLAAYGRSFRADFFHWGTMAAAARYRDTRDAKFVRFAEWQMGEFLRMRGAPNAENTCATAEGFADGLAALVDAGRGAIAVAGGARAWLVREMAKIERLQIRRGQHELAFASARIVAPRLPAFAGDFMFGLHDPRVQVDATAHCLSAMVKIRRNALLH